jgi:hypothetical protein
MVKLIDNISFYSVNGFAIINPNKEGNNYTTVDEFHGNCKAYIWDNIWEYFNKQKYISLQIDRTRVAYSTNKDLNLDVIAQRLEKIEKAFGFRKTKLIQSELISNGIAKISYKPLICEGSARWLSSPTLLALWLSAIRYEYHSDTSGYDTAIKNLNFIKEWYKNNHCKKDLKEGWPAELNKQTHILGICHFCAKHQLK